MMNIGPYQFDGKVFVAPMAGVSDLPLREIVRGFGAAMATAEMVSSNPVLLDSARSRLRIDHSGESGIRAVQIVGTDPREMATAARLNVRRGAQIIDINMGCPAKKICSKLAGSALLRDEKLVRTILQQVVNAVDVPVTLKMRTGWSPESRNGVKVAQIAEQAGIQSLAVHGRTRACGFRGEAEYETIASIKQSVSIPVIVNGDIDSPQKAADALQYTGADGVMVGRAIQGNPWLVQGIHQYLKYQKLISSPCLMEYARVMLDHLRRLHAFYGEQAGVRIARKHLGWYCKHLPSGARLRTALMAEISAQGQLDRLSSYFSKQITIHTGMAA